MSVSSVTSSNSTAGATQSAAQPSSKQTVTTTDFMQLLSAEMANQDPLQPMDPSQTMTQLAQFESLQSSNSINENQSLAAANSFIGAQVTIPGTTANPAFTSVVTGVDDSQVASGGQPMLILSGGTKEYPINSASLVTPAPSGATSPTATAPAAGSPTTASPASPTS